MRPGGNKLIAGTAGVGGALADDRVSLGTIERTHGFYDVRHGSVQGYLPREEREEFVRMTPTLLGIKTEALREHRRQDADGR